MTYYHIYDNFCKPGCIEGDLDQFVVDYLYKAINNDQNGVIIVFFPID